MTENSSVIRLSIALSAVHLDILLYYIEYISHSKSSLYFLKYV